MAYNGTVEVISGLKQKNNGKFPLVHASAVQVDDDDTRLDELLEGMDSNIKQSIDDLIMVQNTQPTSEYNEVWIKSTGDEVQVPTYEEFEDLVENTVHLDEQTITDAQKTVARNNISSASQDDVTDLKSTLRDYNAVDIVSLYGSPSNGTHNYVTYTFTGKNTCKAVGTASSTSFRNIYANTTVLPHGVTAGGKLYCKVSTTNSYLRLAVAFYKSDGTNYAINYIMSDRVLNVPSDAVGLLIRVDTASGKTVNDTITYSILTALTNKELEEKQSEFISAKNATPYVSNSTLTLSDITEDGFYALSTNLTITDAPSDLRVTGLTVERFGISAQNSFVKQIVEDLLYPTTTKRYYRVSNYNGSTWSNWAELFGDSHTNNYTFNEYSNSYEITTTPEITADTNNYLASTGDTTDVTASIMSMLTANGICRLGPGKFYVSGIDMPNYSAIIGSGYSSQIVLIGNSDGYAIKMKSDCELSDLSILGGNSNITLSEIVGGRHGILWQGNYTSSGASASQPQYGIVSNVYIRGFTGGAITCYDTGYGTFNHMEVCNAQIWNCNVGINISYWSEFHKFSNVRTYGCYYGCINNGGNNVFSNNDFSKCIVGLLMDNTNGKSPNNSHGSFSNCLFHHCGSNNDGIGIHIIENNNSEVFTGCQIGGGSSIVIEDSSGIVFNGCVIHHNCSGITIEDGGLVLFNGCSFGSSLTSINVINNTATKFTSCYLADGTTVDPLY